MTSFEEKIAYEIGMRLAYKDYMEKEANLGILRAAGRGAKWLAGFGKSSGGIAGKANRTLGSAVGFGALNTLGTTGFDADRIFSEEGAKLFVGGAAGGVAFSGGMAAAGRLGKTFGRFGNKTYAQTSKGMGVGTQQAAAQVDKNVAKVKKLQEAIKNPTSKTNVQNLQKQLESRKQMLRESKALYKEFLKKDRPIGMFGTASNAIQRSNAIPLLGKGIGIAGGMYGGMQLSGAIGDHYGAKAKPPIQTNNNVFNPVM